VDRVYEELGRIDVLVINAGSCSSARPRLASRSGAPASLTRTMANP
jgi:NAD(P)-dependent dehydrogenase (short-subunit alcohol dehydrogenase family)